MKIVNKKELDLWCKTQVLGLEDAIISIKGRPPDGALYSDGSPITHPINIGWQNTRTGQVFYIMYDFIFTNPKSNPYEHLRKDNS